MGHVCDGACSRRGFGLSALAFGLASAGGARALAETAAPASGLPAQVAGIALPRSAVALKAAELSRRSCPDFLFNHCMRTYLFGALALRRQKLAFDADNAFVAAALHDMGLVQAFESPQQPFEIDGANLAEKFAREAGLTPASADVIWHGIAFHDTRFARRAGPEAMLVAIGAGSDVDGPSLDTEDERKEMAEVVAAFPRLQFKRRFTELAVDHCKRKPLSQRSTWLEGLCREQVPGAWTGSVEKEIAAAPFAE